MKVKLELHFEYEVDGDQAKLQFLQIYRPQFMPPTVVLSGLLEALDSYSLHYLRDYTADTPVTARSIKVARQIHGLTRYLILEGEIKTDAPITPRSHD